ncbi:MAG: hemerythrin domain-containing protein [Dehalococcoidia bacterium]
MKRDPELVPLSRDHHKGLMMALRIERELPDADAEGLNRLYSDLIAFWAAGLLPHFRTENECLLARLLRHVPPDDELIRRTQGDHLTIEGLVATMRDRDDIEERRDALRRFGETLRTHIRWEEEVLFEETQRLLERGEMAALGRDVEERIVEACVVEPPPRKAGGRE